MNRQPASLLFAAVLILAFATVSTAGDSGMTGNGPEKSQTLPALSSTELSVTWGRGLPTDMTPEELDRTLGRGVTPVSVLTPEDIAQISARGILSDEQTRLKIKDLEKITAQGVTFVVDKSKIDPSELEKIKGRGIVKDIGKAPFSVQVGVYKIRENAISMLEDLKKRGYDPYIFQTLNDSKENIYAVRIGDYESIQDAYAVTTHFQAKEHMPAIVTYINSLKTVSIEELKPTAKTEITPAVVPMAKIPEGDAKNLYEELDKLKKEVEKLKAEAEAREMLRMTKAEEKKEEEEILSAVERKYVMSPKGTLNIDYSFGYTYNTYDVADWTSPSLVHTANHSLTNRVSAGYSFKDNLRCSVTVPFVYKYDKLAQSDSKTVSDIGDIDLAVNWQPYRTGGDIPAFIFTTDISIPTGRSPYEINPREDLPTGTGLLSVSVGVSGSKTIDPVVIYGGLVYSYAFEESGLNQSLSISSTKSQTLIDVKPTGAIGASLGLAYALSYKLSIHTAFTYSYILDTTYEYADGSSNNTGTSAAASLTVGAGWKLSKRTISINLGLGLTNDASDFSFSFRIPFDYEL